MKGCANAFYGSDNESLLQWVKDSGGSCHIIDTSNFSNGPPQGVNTYGDLSSCISGQSSDMSQVYTCDGSEGFPTCVFSSAKENYKSAPWSRPSNYANLNGTWAPQKPFTL